MSCTNSLGERTRTEMLSYLYLTISEFIGQNMSEDRKKVMHMGSGELQPKANVHDAELESEEPRQESLKSHESPQVMSVLTIYQPPRQEKPNSQVNSRIPVSPVITQPPPLDPG